MNLLCYLYVSRDQTSFHSHVITLCEMYSQDKIYERNPEQKNIIRAHPFSTHIDISTFVHL